MGEGGEEEGKSFCVEADNVCFTAMLSCSDHGLQAAGSAVHLYGAPPLQKVGADQVMGVSSPRKRFITVSLAFSEIFVALFPFW